MTGIAQIWERLFIGSFQDAEALADANPHGIGTVITLCEKPMLRRNPAIHYVHIPIADATPITHRRYEQVLDAISEGIRGNVLLHCGAGISRTPVIAALWMHRCGYKNIDSALEEIAEMCPTIDPSPILLMSIKEHL